MSCVGRWGFSLSFCGCGCFSDFGDLHCFSSPSLFKSSLTLLLFKFVKISISISSGCFSGVYCFLSFFFFGV